ncbi:MAG: MBL fold metallo-hydrolase [Methanobrevibacter sp.]|jgi:glyoxylase-like metal-dependent hydrolase (beta-lactamase superfamily II)|nr:MBL fold metallo-hydrolase [Methanobrevibacter sp.]
MKIDDGIIILEVETNSLIINSKYLYPVLIYDDKNLCLIDTGLPDSYNSIKNKIDNEGFDIANLNKIIFTHQDIDHIGGLRSILSKVPKIETMAHKLDKPFIEGDISLERSKFIKGKFKSFLFKLLMNYYITFKKILFKIDKTLENRDILDISGGINVIHTPGHTPGHICLYHKKSKTMIVGDELRIINGELVGVNENLMNEEDVRTAYNSLKSLLDYDIKNIVTFHNGLFKNNPNKAIKNLIEKFGK